MGKKRDYEEDDEEDDDIDEKNFFKMPFNPFDIFTNPEKFLKSKEFQSIMKEILGNLFKDFPGELKNLSFEDLMKEFSKFQDISKLKNPIMAGIKINLGPDGKIQFDKFGNIQKEPISGETEVRDTREPLVEVNEEENQIIVIAEMPGVIKEDIELKADVRSLTISTKENPSGRNYYKEVALPSAINPDYAKARYTNGILEVKLKKSTGTQKKDIKID